MVLGCIAVLVLWILSHKKYWLEKMFIVVGYEEQSCSSVFWSRFPSHSGCPNTIYLQPSNKDHACYEFSCIKVHRYDVLFRILFLRCPCMAIQYKITYWSYALWWDYLFSFFQSIHRREVFWSMNIWMVSPFTATYLGFHSCPLLFTTYTIRWLILVYTFHFG